LLRASADDRLAIDGLRVVAERKLPEVEALMELAGVVHRWLEAARECTCPTFEDCPLIEATQALPDRVGARAATGQPSGKGVDRRDSALR
jgi:hypothetical protein